MKLFQEPEKVSGKRKIGPKTPIFFGVFAALLFISFYFFYGKIFSVTYEPALEAGIIPDGPEEIKKFVPAHLQTPEPLKAVYMTSWVAGEKKLREGIVKLIDETELNAVVIDIKDYTGMIAFPVSDPLLVEIGAGSKRFPDAREFIDYLHKKNIYVIGRISVFQDPFLVKFWPEEAVKKESDKNVVWKDYKGISWIDAGSKKAWDYTVALAKESYEEIGFDELNFDYIRFPSDGNMKDIYYPKSEGRKKHEVLEDFFYYLSGELKGIGAKTSADLFGMTTTNKDDLNIGQVLEKALPYFDYVSPMVYPSHYPANWNGFKNPAAYPYEVVKISMESAYERASTTPEKLRPWLQDFNLGAVYTADMVRKQKQAVYDAGLTSWMMWSAANKYTRGALEEATRD